VLISLLLSACVPRSPSEAVPPSAATTAQLPTPAPTFGRAPTAGPATASGQFEIKNTSTDVAEVLVETMDMVFDYQPERTGPWQALAATCSFVPAAPVLVRETQTVRYDCQLQHAIPPDAELRATVEIRLFGSDQVFRLQVQQ